MNERLFILWLIMGGIAFRMLTLNTDSRRDLIIMFLACLGAAPFMFGAAVVKFFEKK